jgi:hypothetical protein
MTMTKVKRTHRVAKELARFQPLVKEQEQPMKKSSTSDLISLTSKPRSGFMALLGKNTVDYVRAELGVDEFRSVFIKCNAAYEGGKSVAVDLAFVGEHTFGSRKVGPYQPRENHRSVQLGCEPDPLGIPSQKWGLVSSRLERLTASYDGYDELLKRNPSVAKSLAAVKKIVALRFITEYDTMPNPLQFDRVKAASSKFIKVKPKAEQAAVVQDPIAVEHQPAAPKAAAVLNNPPILREVVDGRVDMALAISVNGSIARERLVKGLSASQLIEVLGFIDRFDAR